jgi:peptidoglycan/xylan/chitin deacetylase (PgdA/CDA1 family)
MLCHHDLRGQSLPERTVCLTYDDGPGETTGDGPGPRTSEIGRFLYERGIVGTFFVVGQHAERYPETMVRLQQWGHIIGNHTYSHPGLVDLARAEGDVVGEIARTDAIIRKYVHGRKVLLRPPYGSWREKSRPDGPQDAATSTVADLLNRSGRFPDYIGPIKWDIVGEDWECWRQGLTPAEATRRHVEATERVGRGIILLHDSADEPELRARNRTLELTQLLVAALQARGYRFVGVQQVPDIRSFLESESSATAELALGRRPPRL